MPQDAAPGDCPIIGQNSDPQKTNCQPARMAQTSEAVVHLRPKGGGSACGQFKTEPPWPGMHLWARIERGYLVTCPHCQRILQEIHNGRSRSR